MNAFYKMFSSEWRGFLACIALDYSRIKTEVWNYPIPTARTSFPRPISMSLKEPSATCSSIANRYGA